jgi:uncharacterized protein (DUF58 family)
VRLPRLLRLREPEPSTADRQDLASHVRRIELTARRLMDSPALGHYESVFRGHGIEFSEVRAYQPGDPFQSIDWKVTARMRRPYVKRFVEERELTVLLVVDVSASNDFGTRGKLKRRLAAEVAGVLALAAMRSQDRVGLLLFTDRVERYIRPLRGRNRSLRLLYELLSHRPKGRGTDIGQALITATRLLPVRSLVFVLSDFTGDAHLMQPFLAVSSRHDVVAIDIRDRAEEALPEAGWVEVEDPETGERAVVDLLDRRVRAALERHADEEERRLTEVLQRSRVDRISVRGDEPYVPALAAFFAARGRRRRR